MLKTAHAGAGGLPGQHWDFLKIQSLASASVSKSPIWESGPFPVFTETNQRPLSIIWGSNSGIVFAIQSPAMSTLKIPALKPCGDSLLNKRPAEGHRAANIEQLTPPAASITMATPSPRARQRGAQGRSLSEKIPQARQLNDVVPGQYGAN
jgi:hypothetical protein